MDYCREIDREYEECIYFGSSADPAQAEHHA